MIPKTIHYCWFGHTKKCDLILDCIKSWEKTCPDYSIIEWNENNFDINSHPFTKFAYQNKKWAFVSDYVRFKVLNEKGGVYLDTDMFLIKNLDDLLDNHFFSAYEDDNFISCGAIGSEKENTLIKKCLEYYDKNINTFTPVPKILTNCYKELNDEEKNKIKIYPKNYFYPFNQEEIKKWNGNNAPSESYGIHLWNYSWGHPLNKFFKKIGIYNILKKISETLGIKKILKKFFGFI
jgi:mannosyltransferase OCH1-like enzyme